MSAYKNKTIKQYKHEWYMNNRIRIAKIRKKYYEFGGENLAI